jgi:hypothetical protein
MALVAKSSLRATALRGVLVSAFATLLLMQGALRWRWLALLVLLVGWAALAPIGACVSIVLSRLASASGFKRFAMMIFVGVVIATLLAWMEAFGFHLVDPMVVPDPLGIALPPGMIMGAVAAYLEYRFQGIRRTEAGTRTVSAPEERANG